MEVLTYVIESAAGATTTNYLPVPCRCVLLGAYAAADYEAGADTTVVLNNASTAQISFALDATTTLADVATGTVNATTIFEEGTAIKIVTSDDAGSAEGSINLTIMYDPFLAGVSGT